MKNLLTIAGSDCSGGAGIQADLKTFSAHGAYGMSVIASVVAENTSRVISIQDIDPGIISDQIDAVFEDIRVDGVKVGMLSNAEIMRIVAAKLEQYRAPKPVIDPVMIAKGGSALMQSDALETLIQEMIPRSFLLTPNIPEAETITEKRISNISEMEEAARIIYGMGAKNVLIKGGHLTGDAEDILFDGKEFFRFRSERLRTSSTHGTGCTFSSAIAANLAKDIEIREAVATAKEYITMAIGHAVPIGKGYGPVNHFYQFCEGNNERECHTGKQSSHLSFAGRDRSFESALPENEHSCSICGKMCARKTANEILAGKNVELKKDSSRRLEAKERQR